jgi:hypothetical protein
MLNVFERRRNQCCSCDCDQPDCDGNRVMLAPEGEPCRPAMTGDGSMLLDLHDER